MYLKMSNAHAMIMIIFEVLQIVIILSIATTKLKSIVNIINLRTDYWCIVVSAASACSGTFGSTETK